MGFFLEWKKNNYLIVIDDKAWAAETPCKFQNDSEHLTDTFAKAELQLLQ